MAVDSGAVAGKGEPVHLRPRVLIAGSRRSADLLRSALSFDAEFLFAQTIDEALRHVEAKVCIVLCDVRFDESRMFNFLHELGNMSVAQGLAMVCCRVSDAPLTPSTYRAIEVALEALGVHDFIDLPRLVAQHGRQAAAGLLRERVLERLCPRFKAACAAEQATPAAG